MKKRALSMILVVIMLMTLLPTYALAGDAPSGEPVLKARWGSGGLLMERLGQGLFDEWEMEYLLCYPDGTMETVAVEDLQLPAFLQRTDFGFLKAVELGEGCISYERDGKTYELPITIGLPHLGIYSSTEFTAENLWESFRLTEESKVFYIAINPERAAEGFRMTAVNTEMDSQPIARNLLDVAQIELSDDGSYATVTVTDLRANDYYDFFVSVEWNETSSENWGRGIRIQNELPGLYYCYVWRENEGWVPNPYAEDEMTCTPGYEQTLCFYYGSSNDVEAGKCEPLAIEELDFPAFLTVREVDDPACKVPNVVSLHTTRFAEENEMSEIRYTHQGNEYSIPVETMLPDFGFYTEPEASRAAYIYEDGNPFVVTKENRTFYLCASNPERARLLDVESDSFADSFEIETCKDTNGVTYFKFTLKDGEMVPDSGFSVSVRCERRWGDHEWEEVFEGVWTCLKNGEPTLMWKYMDWDDEKHEWFVPEDAAFNTAMWLEFGDQPCVQFFYGTEKENVPVDLEALTYDNNVLSIESENRATCVSTTAYEAESEIVYEGDGETAKLRVYVQPPSYGFYSEPTASEKTFLGAELVVNGAADDTFYLVAGEGRVLKGIEGIWYWDPYLKADDQFDVTFDPDGKFATVKLKKDADGNLLPGGKYSIEIQTEWGVWHREFTVLRMDLPALTTPTELEWHKEYRWSWMPDTEEPDRIVSERMGAMSFRTGEHSQNRYQVEIYAVTESGEKRVHDGNWHFGDLNHDEYLTVTDFIYGEFPSGAYKFRVRAMGDGTKFRDSAWSEFSETWTYTAPEKELTAPDAATFDWLKGTDGYFSTWQHTGEEDVGYYEIQWFSLEGDQKRYYGGCFDSNAMHLAGQEIVEERLFDEILEDCGEKELFFEVRAIPKDITKARLSVWSASGKPLDVENITETTNQKLDNLLKPSEPDAAPPTVAQVQEALKDDTADLRTAMAADLSLSGGPSSGTLDRVQALEAAVSNNVDQKVEAKNSAPEKIKEIVQGVTMIGATLNLEDKAPEEGKKPTVTLEFDEPKEGIVVDDQQHNAVQFSMKLNGAIDKDDQEQAGQQLVVPVVIDMPVPEGINPDFLVILHKKWDKSIEQMWPYLYKNEDDGKMHARFVVDSFSDFAMLEYNFRFEKETVTRTEGDAAFTFAALGSAKDSKVTYTSSNPEVAKVDPETGLVTILKAGKAVITATAEATEVYPEAEASYELIVEEKAQPQIPVYVPTKYALQTASTTHGKLTLSTTSAAKGTTVTVTVTPDQGYTLETIAAKDGSGSEITLTAKELGKTYTFTMPASAVTVAATFMEDNAMLNFFVDVPADAYYYDAVLWAAQNKITDGTSETTFSPAANCARGQIVTFLWRAMNCPEPTGAAAQFTDVAQGAFYEKAVAWAAENKITGGITETAFDPLGTCTRAQAITFLWRAKGSPKAQGDASRFTDVAADSYYAEAVAWAIENGITNGTSETTFSPAETCTRAQIVTFLLRAFGK